MSAQHGIALIDATLAEIEEIPSQARTEQTTSRRLELLAIREAVTREPDWSAIVEGNLRTQLAAAVARADAAVAEAEAEESSAPVVDVQASRVEGRQLSVTISLVGL